MISLLRAVADGLRDPLRAPGLLLLALLHTAVASLVFGLALGVAGGVTSALGVLDDAERTGLMVTRALDPSVTSQADPVALAAVPAAFEPVLDADDPQAYLVADGVAFDDPVLDGALVATPGLAGHFGNASRTDANSGVYFAPSPLPGDSRDGTFYLGAVPLGYAGPLPADAAVPRGDGSLLPLSDETILVADTVTVASLVGDQGMTTAFSSVVARPDAIEALRGPMDRLEEATGITIEFVPVNSASSTVAREARGAALMVTAYTAALASAVVTVVGLLTTLTRRLTPEWLAHAIVGAPRWLLRLRIATSVSVVWGAPAVLGSLLGVQVAADAGGLSPTPLAVVAGLGVILAIGAVCTLQPVRHLSLAIRTAAPPERTF